MSRIASTIVIALLAGCASYGWADRSGSSTAVERRVTVRTIDVDADAATDAASLTRSFVERLRAAGVSDARWSSAPLDRDVVECDVALHESASFGNVAEVSASARCRIDGETLPERTALAQMSLDPANRLDQRRRVAELAARRALDAIAGDVASRLQHDP